MARRLILALVLFALLAPQVSAQVYLPLALRNSAGIAPTPTATATPTVTATATPSDRFLVTRIIDGDTIELENGQKVRYIGIDTPESGDCYAWEATQRNRELVLGQWVRLVKDVSETDFYGRLLRYVYVGSGAAEVFVNAELVRQGYALAYTYPPDVAFAALFVQLQQEARENERGLWSACVTMTPTPTETRTATGTWTPTATGTATSTASSTWTWTPSATASRTFTPTATGTWTPTRTWTATWTRTPTRTNTVKPTMTHTPTLPPAVCPCHADLRNCGDFTTQAAAQACYDYCMVQVGYDVHHLDSDGDGEACESLP